MAKQLLTEPKRFTIKENDDFPAVFL